ncbi:MAG: hypothetical protein H6656_01245 [Ardenticatenaceae bacterium]|nr:hypothetical protein [Ardenticatenaceae bacterium]
MKLLLAFATADNWQAMTELAKIAQAALAVQADSLDAMVALTEKIKADGWMTLSFARRSAACTAR